MIRFRILLLALCALAACAGDTGPMGPAGPAGAQGDQGETGATGLPGNVAAFDRVEHTVKSGDYTTGSGLLILDARISLDTYLETYVATTRAAFPAYVTLDVYGEQELAADVARPYVAVFGGGLIVVDPDRALLGATLVVAVLPP